MAVVGPGATQNNVTDQRAALEGATEYEYVTILNPLTDDFAVLVAQDVPVNMPFDIRQDISGKTSAVTKDEAGARQMYGLNLKNPDFQGRQHISNTTVIPAGETINLKGNEAQVAVRQIVNEMLQRLGNGRLIADPTLRAELEKQVIISRGSVQDLMDNNLQSQRSQIDDAISKSNEVRDEPAFPELSQPASEATTVQERRAPGRPKKNS